MPPKLVSRRIYPQNIASLDKVAGIEPGSVSLHAKGLDAAGYARLARFLGEHGNLVRSLKVQSGYGINGHGELQHIDFAASCPNLRTLDVKRVAFNDSVFAHPALVDLRLRESKYVGGSPIVVDKEQPLRILEFHDCLVKVDTLAIAADSEVRRFRYYLDEDYAEACPDNFDVYGKHLEEITINACWTYTVTTNRASERHNRHRTFRAGQYGNVTHVYYKDNGDKVVQEYGAEAD
ncbi:hypothetical protein [Streptomyces sp. I05A-00742]|uniref:hypothetical protein n=1 Tax=Streptomyces sp. I05A-00742 TaxID=2732853 RepID=UPI001487E90F|nr:hypothetical protein [Streptomyces sp. I05A-00742]